MKQHITLSIPLPCSEKWEEFLPDKDGAFCQHCCKTIVDFTQMSDDEVIQFFFKKPSNACGRFREDQMRLYTKTAVHIETGFPLLKAGILSLIMLLINDRLNAQTLPKEQVEVTQTTDQTIHENQTEPTFTIKGVVREKDGNLPMPGANVLLKGTEKGIATDVDGKFEFPQKLKDGDVLVFTFIGYKTQEFVVTRVGLVDISLDVDLDMEMLDMPVVMGEVNVQDHTSRFGLRKLVSKIKSMF
jgi:hypothetical protein